MRIAQVAPLFEAVPPVLYGGTERVVAYLTDALVALRHDVTLFASGDSRTRAALEPMCERGLRLDGQLRDPLALHLVMIERAAARASDFDALHFHTGHLHLPVARRLQTGTVTTLHGPLDLPEHGTLFDEFREAPLVSISDAQRTPIPDANWVATIPHGLPADLYGPGDGQGGYFAFLGRIAAEKRPDRAIAIASALKRPLKIAAKIDPADEDYFAEQIRPLLDNPFVEFVGEIGEQQKAAFLGAAVALLFPIDWREPFGLVMIEALACGTPVIAFRGGSVPEVIDHGETGFIVDSIDGAIAAADRVSSLDRRACRRAFETRFTDHRMAEQYVSVYEALS